MTDIEFDIIDELYFVTPFKDILANLDLPQEELGAQLFLLMKKGFVKAFYPDPDTEVELNEERFEKKCVNCFYLATKAGLLAHNSR
ncbi:hypothetical protein [Adhaeribacter aquaticus]|uniref:hypothetical protein n=1 Tax=Adhaeribacter aquaticus TaxID=299567 RepID=UPI0003F8583E|nr:hypothetical protein [Adhaeribacter aquaticus]